jgi:hypothetical protein
MRISVDEPNVEARSPIRDAVVPDDCVESVPVQEERRPRAARYPGDGSTSHRLRGLRLLIRTCPPARVGGSDVDDDASSAASGRLRPRRPQRPFRAWRRRSVDLTSQYG